MAKALFLGLPLHGHVNPTLPLVRALAGRGEAVAYYASDRFRAAIEQTGAIYRPYDNASLSDLRTLPTQTDEISWWLMRAAADTLERSLEAFRAEHADYVIADSVAPWGQWTARILRLPVVTSISTFAFNRHVMAFAAAHRVRPKSARRLLTKLRYVSRSALLHRRLCRQYGVTGPGVLGSVMGHSDLNIVYTSRYFQPRAETFDERFQFVGPMASRVETTPFAWERLDSRPLVYISLGTLFNTDIDFYRRCFEAFGGSRVQVVMSTGTNVRHEALGQPPANFIVAAAVPQLAVLARARAFVTHGGMNSVSESFANGVPVVAIPQMGEQALVGRRAEQLGAGLYLAKEDVTPEALSAAVQRILDEPGFSRQVAAIRTSFQNAGGAERAASAILAYRDPDRGAAA